MKYSMIIKLVYILPLVLPLVCKAAVPQTHIYRTEDNKFDRIEGHVDVSHCYVDDKPFAVFTSNGKSQVVPVENIDEIQIRTVDIPRIYINIPDYQELRQVEDKETYLSAKIYVEGNGYVDDMEETDVSVKGRGNSTWKFPKKPMRLKFAKKRSLAGLVKAKSFVLLANYVDPTLMRNAVAMKLAQMLEVPCANNIVPCNVSFNGYDLGAFMLTEKIGINAASVDIDENSGILFELSTEFDEPYKFRSKNFSLPVMVKEPDLDEICKDNPLLGTPNDVLASWEKDFNRAEQLAVGGRGFEAFDLDSFVSYMLLYNLCGNNEIGFPKSLYLHKVGIGDDYRYITGPAWDFDVAFNLYKVVDDEGCYVSPESTLWVNRLFAALTDTSAFKKQYKEKLARFRTDIMPKFLEYFDELALLMRPSAKVNGMIWPADENYDWVYALNSFNNEMEVEALRKWIVDRVIFLERRASSGQF